MSRDLIHFRNDIIECCKKIQSFIAGHTFDTFLRDTQIYDAVLMNFIIIGEAGTHFPDEVRVAMINFLIHEYFEINPKVVWKTAHDDIPILLEQVEKMKI
jgi:uncharacterized protein with HEPN domain